MTPRDAEIVQRMRDAINWTNGRMAEDNGENDQATALTAVLAEAREAQRLRELLSEALAYIEHNEEGHGNDSRDDEWCVAARAALGAKP